MPTKTQNSYRLTLWWPLGLHNTSLDTKFRIQNSSFFLINQWLTIPGSTVSLNWGICPKYTKRCSTLFNATFTPESFRLFTMHHYPWFNGLHSLFPVASMHQIYQQFNSNSTNSPYTWKRSCWMQILKLQDLGHLWFISSHHLEAAGNYNK